MSGKKPKHPRDPSQLAKLMAASLAIFLSTPVSAAEWVFITSGQNMPVYLDTSSISARGSDLVVWLKYDYSQMPSKDAEYSIDKVELRCTHRQMRTLSVIKYNANGSVIRTTEFPDDPFYDIPPETVALGLYQRICERQFSN